MHSEGYKPLGFLIWPAFYRIQDSEYHYAQAPDLQGWPIDLPCEVSLNKYVSKIRKIKK